MKVQSKKYSKYLTGVASAALVASAVAPVVSAADFNDVQEDSSHKAAIDALTDAEIITGYPDGSFKPNKTLTRSDVVKLMGKWLVSMDYKIPEDYKTNPRFKDLTSETNDELLQYSAIVKDNNVFKGYEDGTLKATGNITRENMAMVLVRAYDAVHKTDLVNHVKEEDFDRDVIDLAKAKDEAHPYIDVLDYFDITNPIAPNFRPKETTTRAQFASFLYKTSQVEMTIGEVVATTTQVDAAADQVLTFSVDGKPADLSKLKEAGYTVEFQSNKANVLKDKNTGALDETKLTAGDTFSYKVVVSKDGEKVESDLVEVKVLDFASYISEIDEVSIKQGDVKVKSGNVSVEDGTVSVVATTATSLNGTTIPAEDFTATYSSSNPSVATVDANTGEVKPVSPGQVDIQVKVNNATKNVPLTVVSGKRTASNVEVLSDTPKLIVGKKQVVELVVTDQYGDLYDGLIEATSKDEAIIKAQGNVAAQGSGAVRLEAMAAGSTEIQVKNGETVLATFTASVSNDTTVDSRKLESLFAADDLQLDAIEGSEDNEVTLVLNQYNKDGFLIGAENDAKYVASSSDESVAKVVQENGFIDVTAVNEGTATIEIKEGDVTIATATITVVNSTPEVSSIEFEKVEPITTTTIDAQVLRPEGIQLTSTEFTPNISASGEIFIKNGDATINLGTIAKSYSGNVADVTDLTVEGGKVTGTATAGAKGTIVVSVKKSGQTVPLATKSIEVNVPADQQ